jgi:type VI secretion system protein ImpA
VIDSAKFTTELPGIEPSGPNLEYDPDFLALERALQGRPEQVIGDTVKPGEDPDWPDVCERAETLLGRTRDLRVVAALTTALLRTEGFVGLAAGLSILRGLLEEQWETVHPQLDAEDDNDPTSRVNSLMGLATGDGLLKALRETPLVYSKTLGRFSLRDIRIASGKQPAPANLSEPPRQAQIDGAFKDADSGTLEATAGGVSSALDHVGAIDRVLIDKVGAQAPDLKPLVLDLTELKHLLADRLGGRAGASGAAAAGEGSGAGASGGGVGVSDAIESRDDVIRQLDRLCEYYKSHEPSSPIPLLLQRAKRLVSKDFMDIIRDLAPSGVAEVESIGGVEKGNE